MRGGAPRAGSGFANCSRACASRSICPWSWLASTTERPASNWKRISSSTSASVCGSRPLVGSSSSSTRGSSIIARASAKRWRSPVESSLNGRSSKRGFQRHRRQQPVEALALRPALLSETPGVRSPSTTPVQLMHNARVAAIWAHGFRAAPRHRQKFGRARHRDRRWRAAAGFCRNPTDLRQPSIRHPRPMKVSGGNGSTLRDSTRSKD